MSDDALPVPEYKCKICSHHWIPRSRRPIFCPFCHSRDWEKGRDETKAVTKTKRPKPARLDPASAAS